MVLAHLALIPKWSWPNFVAASAVDDGESWRHRLPEPTSKGGEKGDGLRIGLFDNSKMAGASRRTTMLYQGWPGVGFFKHSRGNCGVFREAV